jgi:glycosyltransferase involved in cell wall biosynthesis
MTQSELVGMHLTSNQISAILVFYNAESTIRAAIEAILTQSIAVDEIILVDDASTDMSSEVILKLVQDFKQIKLIRNEFNLGAAKSRNIGVDYSTGGYVVFFDSDDISSEDRIRIHLDALRNADISFVSSCKDYTKDYLTVHKNTPFIGLIPYPRAVEQFVAGFKFKENFYVPACTLAVRRSSFLSIEGFDGEMSRLEDVDFALRAARAELVFHFSDQVLVRRMSSGGNYKSGEVESKAQLAILERYRPDLDIETYQEVKSWYKIREAYFARKRTFLARLLISYLLKHPRAGYRYLAGIRRLLHDSRIKKTLRKEVDS